MDLVVATAAEQVPTDFYAGAAAAFVVIVFAKFATHTHPRKHKTRNRLLAWVVGPGGHAVCIGFAWLGLVLSLLMLTKEWLSEEEWIRWVVGGLAVVAGLILSLDTALPRSETAAAMQPDGQAEDADPLAETNNPKYVLDAYEQLCTSYHGIDDFRAKLLGFLPLVTGGGLVLLTGRTEEVREEFFGPVGLFGIAVTAGLLAYELFGITKCHALINAAKAMERDMKVPAGQFRTRPNNLLGVVNEPFAAALIYSAALAAWTYLALLYVNPSLGMVLSGLVFIGGGSLILVYDWTLRREDKRKEDERKERQGHQLADTQAQATHTAGGWHSLARTVAAWTHRRATSHQEASSS
jgi:hypothetical protein